MNRSPIAVTAAVPEDSSTEDIDLSADLAAVPGGYSRRHVAGKVEGVLDRDEIQKVINKNISQIQRCYERELLRSTELAGKVRVEWIIATSGSVRIARLKSATLKSSNTVNCLLDKITAWKFPKPRGGEVVVDYPFIFQSIGF